MVLPDSDGMSRVPPYSGSTPEEIFLRLQGSYLLWPTVPGRFVWKISWYLQRSVLQPRKASLSVCYVSVYLASNRDIVMTFFCYEYYDVLYIRVSHILQLTYYVCTLCIFYDCIYNC